MESICNVNCNECQMRNECGGCVITKGKPFGGTCILALNYYNNNCSKDSVCSCKKQIIKEFNELNVKDMPEIKELYSLKGSFVNLEYKLDNGSKIKLLNDNDIYLGNQLNKNNSNKCYGIVADNNFLLVCEYEENGENAEIIVYTKRKK